MHNIDSIYFFVFIFTILVFIQNSIKIISSLLDEEPKGLTSRELIILGLSISYITTYINYEFLF
jgi:hypothetical protein